MNEQTERNIADQVEKRAAALLGEEDLRQALQPHFVRDCLEANERGDGVMFATIHRDRFLLNTTNTREQEWYRWCGHVWEVDEKKRVVSAVDDCALEYQRQVDELQARIEREGISDKKKHPDGWVIAMKELYEARIKRLRSQSGALKALFWAPIVEESMACSEADFNQRPWLLPVKNGVINLQTGALMAGRPEDRLTKALDIDYDPRADYGPILDFLHDISYDDMVKGSADIPGFLKRFFGYAATGFAHEQYILFFLGPGRNGKGVLFSLLGDVLGPYYHEINNAMLLEQRNDPSPNAASEHKYSLLGKRLIVGAETNKGKRIDAQAIKGLTGEDRINCRPNFGREINFDPTHTLCVHTNHLPHGLTADFALLQRLLLVEFPWRYVDDPAAEAKKYPRQADRFRQKDPTLKTKLKAHRQGLLRWIVEGCLEWQEKGLAPPDCILQKVTELEKDNDYMGQFIGDCLHHPENPGNTKLPCKALDDAFKWWWSVNMDSREQKVPHVKTVNKALRERGYNLEKIGGLTNLLGVSLKFDIVDQVDEYVRAKRAKS